MIATTPRSGKQIMTMLLLLMMMVMMMMMMMCVCVCAIVVDEDGGMFACMCVNIACMSQWVYRGKRLALSLHLL